MEEQKIDRGSVVQLKSGGPNMTVQGPDTGGHWHCVWFEDYNKESRGSFHPAALVLVNQDEGT